jgi:hypothetical protein
MAGIKAPIQDILTRLTSLQVVNQNQATVPLYARIWNNQLRIKKEDIYAIPYPCAFVELVSPINYDRILNGLSEADLIIRIHLAHEFYDAQDGTFEQDLLIFDLRDKIVTLLSNYQPTACGVMFLNAEQQEYDHDNVYHYIIDFKCGFIDSKGSPYDPGAGVYIDSAPPTALVVTAQKVLTLP